MVIHSLGDKRLKSSLLALTPCALTCCLLNQKQVTLPPVTKLWARAPAPWLHPYLHPSLEWFCFDSFWAPWWYSQGETLCSETASLSMHPLNVLLFVWIVYRRIQARVLGMGCISLVEFCTSLPESHSIPFMPPLSQRVILEWSYWLHSPWRACTQPCPSSWPSHVEEGKVGCGKQEDSKPCLAWWTGNISNYTQPCAQITTFWAYSASQAGAKVIPAACDRQCNRKNLS